MKYVLLLLVPLLFLQNASAESHRMNRKFGFGLALNDPPPAQFGINLHYNYTDFLQLQFGMGFNSQGLGESVVDEIGTTTVTAVFWIITLGLIDWEKIRDFVKDEDETVVRTVFTWGGGINLYVPGWNLSPTLGVGLGSWSANNSPFGLSDSGSHVYYKAGIEWQTSTIFALAAGWAHAPALPEALSNKFFSHLKLMF